MDSPQYVLLALAAFFFALWIPIVLGFFAKRMRDRRERGAGAESSVAGPTVAATTSTTVILYFRR